MEMMSPTAVFSDELMIFELLIYWSPWTDQSKMDKSVHLKKKLDVKKLDVICQQENIFLLLYSSYFFPGREQNKKET